VVLRVSAGLALGEQDPAIPLDRRISAIGTKFH